MAIKTKPTRIVVVGAGAVGATTAYTLFLRSRATEIVLIDTNVRKANGEVLDMQHGLPFVGGSRIWVGTYQDCADADIVIVTAGVAQRPGETRQQLLVRNVRIMRDVVGQLRSYNFQGILLVATNPVDVLSYVANKEANLPAGHVIGSGTVLDSARFRFLLGSELGVDPRSVHAHIIGEHGDTEVPVWSTANVVGTLIDLTAEKRRRVALQTRKAAYEIIESKGYTSYAIALALDRICTAILYDEHAVLNVSTLLHEYRGISDVYMGVPCVIGASGVENVIDLPLSVRKQTAFEASARELRARIQQALAIAKEGEA
ncbi:lactate dehydrogenase [Alicyclobacillus tengchongensis]|nr:lactate dehydrogenase [Alicyclobacillus tengchongensis]